MALLSIFGANKTHNTFIMNWNYYFGTTEYFFIFLFILLNVLYIFRTVRVARKLKTTARSLIVKLVLRSVAFGLLLVSLLGPSFGETQKEVKSLGKDIFVVIDLSRSMKAMDVIPSRLEKVKFELSRFVDNQSSNRIGIIAFSNKAYMQVPLTYDRDALQLFIHSLQTELIPGQGSNLCAGLEMVFEKMSKPTNGENRSKLAIVFTDGEESDDCPGALFNNFRRYGIAVKVVGVGSYLGTTIKDGSGLLEDDEGKLVITKLDDGYLTQLTGKFNSNPYYLRNEKNDLNQLILDINEMSSSFVDAKTFAVETDKYYYFLGAALVLLLLDVLITIGTFRL